MERNEKLKCCLKTISSGLENISQAKFIMLERRGMIIMANVQNQEAEEKIHPYISNKKNANGITLRRRLSNIFHLDNNEIGFFLNRLSLPWDKREYPTCYLPIAPDPAMPALHISFIIGWIIFV